jgi:hypothetical protein
VTAVIRRGSLAIKSFGDDTGLRPVRSPKLLVAKRPSTSGGVKVREATGEAGMTLTPSTAMAALALRFWLPTPSSTAGNANWGTDSCRLESASGCAGQVDLSLFCAPSSIAQRLEYILPLEIRIISQQALDASPGADLTNDPLRVDHGRRVFRP